MKQIGTTRPVREMLDRLPAKYLTALEDNADLKPCCRKAKDCQVSLHQTDDALTGPDLLVMECGCGRKHYRVAAGGTKAQI